MLCRSEAAHLPLMVHKRLEKYDLAVLHSHDEYTLLGKVVDCVARKGT